jgi:uncharacterized FlaG/YvyC family protein
MDIANIPSNGPVATTSPTGGNGNAVPLTPEQTSRNRELIKAVKAVNSSELFGQDSELTFVFDRENRRALVRVINKQTREVMMQIPPEYVIKMAEEKSRS